jgi:hypothetical protein
VSTSVRSTVGKQNAKLGHCDGGRWTILAQLVGFGTGCVEALDYNGTELVDCCF